MSPLSIAAIFAGSWIVVAAVAGAGWSFAVNRLKRQVRHVRRRAPFTTADGTTWAPVLPPVPPPTRPAPLPVWDDADEAAFRWYAEGAR